jgi:hypothetical protein
MERQELRRRLATLRDTYAESGSFMATQAVRALIAVVDEMAEAERHGDLAQHDDLLYTIESEMHLD